MALNVAQLMNPPGGPGVIGAVKGSSSINVSGDGTITVNPATTDLTQYLKLSGGTMTGVLTLESGTVGSPSLVFTNSNGAGFYYRDGTNSISVCMKNNAVMQWDDSDQCITGNPAVIPAGGSSPFGGSVQSWTTTGDLSGSGFTTVRASVTDSPNAGDFKVKRCAGSNPYTPQALPPASAIGGFSAVGCNGTSWQNIVSGLLLFKTALTQNNTSQLSFWTDRGDSLTEWIRIGPIGTLQPIVDNSVDLGGAGTRWNDLYIKNPPVVGIANTEIVASPLDTTVGLDFINSLTPVQYVPNIEYNDVYGVCQNPSDPSDDWVWENSVSPIAGTTTHWGITSEDLQSVTSSLGLGANLGVYVEGQDGAPDGVRMEELIAPLILSVQQLSTALDDLQTAFDAYVAAHP